MKQRAASLVLYIGLVLLALWVLRDFIPVVAWAGVLAIALWPLLRKVEGNRWLTGRTTLDRRLLTLAIAFWCCCRSASALGRPCAKRMTSTSGSRQRRRTASQCRISFERLPLRRTADRSVVADQSRAAAARFGRHKGLHGNLRR